MDRFARGIAFGLMLAVAAALGGCGGGGVGLLTGSTTAAAADAPGALSNDDPVARPVAVAWTSARAQRCGFYFNPTKLRSSYLAFEARQAGSDLAKAEKTYDTTVQTIRQRVTSDPDYCTEAKSAEIKKDLTRHLAGDFRPDLPKPKVAESCGFFGCGGSSQEQFSSDRFWEEQQRRNTR
jgi:hypothetical protein